MAQVTGYDKHRFQVEWFDECVADAHRLLMKAADEWAKGHPEEPPTIDVLNALLDLFESKRLLTRPYGCKRQKS